MTIIELPCAVTLEVTKTTIGTVTQIDNNIENNKYFRRRQIL